MQKKRTPVITGHELRSLANVGPATLGDLLSIGVTSVNQLATCDAPGLFRRLEEVSGTKQNICMLDLFYAIIHEAQTGERRPWYFYSALRRAHKNLNSQPSE